MSAPCHGTSAQPRQSALKADSNSDRAPPLGASIKAVQIAEPESSTPDESQVKKQFSAGVAKRLSGRPPLSTTPSRSATFSQVSMEASPDAAPVAMSSAAPEDSQNSQPRPQPRQRADLVTERLFAQVADWLEREKAKKEHKKTRKHVRHRKSPPQHASPPVPGPGRVRADSVDSGSSEVSLDRLQRILDSSMAALGLNPTPHLGPRLSRRHRKRSSRSLNWAASSDTEWYDGDVVVPSCDAILGNSKSPGYTGGRAGADDPPSLTSTKEEEKEKQGWITFKNEIIRLAHTLKLKGWRRVPLDSGETISVERLSGALTNAVYVVSPPSEALLPREPSKKKPGKVLLRIYGPQAEHLIDRENELGVLRRLGRKKIGPRLLGTFLNGRFEQFWNATALTPDSMREPETSKQIAKRMRELHDGVELLEEEKDQGPGVWKNWDKWLNQVEKTVLFLDRQVRSKPHSLPDGVWKTRGFVCGVEWPVFKALVEKYRTHLEGCYGGPENIRDRLVFAHNDTQYGNILRVRPDDEKSPLLRPANEHKQLVVIDFEYAAANVPGLEFANHFSEWTYNYHDPVRPWACDTSRYPTPEQQRRFIKAYVDHRPQQLVQLPPYAADPSLSSATPPPPTPPPPRPSPGAAARKDGGGGCGGRSGTPRTTTANSTGSVVEFMLDARVVPPGGWREEERRREEAAEARVRQLVDETRLWRTANSAQWVAWGIVQAKVPGADGEGDGDGDGADADAAGGEFDYLAYAQDRAYFFLGDCVLLGLVRREELGEDVNQRIKVVNY